MKKTGLLSIALLMLAGCSSIPKEGVTVLKEKDGNFSLYIDGRKTFINGVGGTNRIDIAAANSANAFRTWGGSVESIRKDLAIAKENGMYVMQGIGLPGSHSGTYSNEDFKAKKREEVRALAETFKDDPNIFLWGIGNEIQLDGKTGSEAWIFVNELSDIIKSIDTRHLTSTVISHDPQSLDSIARYCPSLDLVGINSYGGIETVAEIVEHSDYEGPYLITEWGPTGWWECDKTEWGAPIEQTSEEKRIVYESRYNAAIKDKPRCLGSFCFLWGQKEERTPTWFCMFVESGENVPGLPLKGEKTPMVEAMQRVWSGKEPAQTAPVVERMTVEGRQALENAVVRTGKPFTASVVASDREGDTLTYVWEILYEATKTATGGAYEPRPERIGEVVTTDVPELKTTIKEKGNYRLYAYILDGTGFVSTVNVPFQVR